MWPWGHIAAGFLLLVLYYRLSGDDTIDESTVPIVVVASLLPDLIDKPLAWYLGVLPTGRSLGHSLLFLVPLCILVYWWASRQERPIWGVAFAIGAISHVVLDALPVLWRDTVEANFLLYPLLAVTPYDTPGPPSPSALLAGSLGEPYFVVEIALVLLAILVWHRYGYPGIEWIRSVWEHAHEST